MQSHTIYKTFERENVELWSRAVLIEGHKVFKHENLKVEVILVTRLF